MRSSSVFLTTLLCVCLLATLFGCSNDDDDGGNPIGPVTVDTFYVDPSNAQSGDGSQADPFNSLTAAIAAAAPGDVLQLESGDYDTLETFPLYLKPGMTLVGQGFLTTIIEGTIRDTNHNATAPVTLEDLQFNYFRFERPAAPSAAPDPVTITDCRAYGGIYIWHGGGFSATIVDCQVVGSLNFNHATGSSVNVVRNCQVSGEIHFNCGGGATDSIQDCAINGILAYRSGASNAIISGNSITGHIKDASGEGVQIIRDNAILYNPAQLLEDSAAIICNGSSVTVARNTINALAGASGIIAKSGGPTIIDSNMITVETDLTTQSNGIFTVAGAGHIIGNTITGGAWGLRSASGATLVAYNTITGATNGVLAADAARYLRNTITNCNGDGFANRGCRGPIDSNIITDNGQYGFFNENGPIDLGGGADNGLGGNVFQRNGWGDFLNSWTGTVSAENNAWDHDDSLSIDTADVYDDDEDGSHGAVDFVPFIPSNPPIPTGFSR